MPLGQLFHPYGSYYGYHIGGTPLVAGTFTITITVENEAGSTSKELTLEIGEPKKPVIVATALPNGMVYNSYEEQLISTSPSAVWSIIDGELPSGLWLYDKGIYGEPKETGTFNFTVKAENIFGEDTKTFSIEIELPPLPVFATPSLPNGAVGEQYSVNIILENYAVAVNMKDGSSLPPGLNYTCWDNECQILGIPITTGNFSLTFVAENISGKVEKTYAIEITEDLPPVTDYTVTITQPSNGTIIVFNEGTLVTSGTKLPSDAILDLIATPTDATYVFVKWWDNNENASRQFTLNANTTISATFAEISSSSNDDGGSSSSSDDGTPIQNRENPIIGAIGVQTTYYNLKGEPLGTIKPTVPGVYIEKQGKLTKRIVVR